MSLDAKFFRKARRAKQAVQITDTEAIIPAVRDSAEIRVALPNRRIKTFEERQQEIETRREEISVLEEQIEVERKKLLKLVKDYQGGGSISETVVQNLKIKELMERRSALAYPETWIEELKGLTMKDVFESKRDDRKIGRDVAVYQIKRRVEPISSLYVDLGAKAIAATTKAEEKGATVAATLAAMATDAVEGLVGATPVATPVAEQAAKAKTGAIIGTKIKVKKTAGV